MEAWFACLKTEKSYHKFSYNGPSSQILYDLPIFHEGGGLEGEFFWYKFPLQHGNYPATIQQWGFSWALTQAQGIKKQDRWHLLEKWSSSSCQI